MSTSIDIPQRRLLGEADAAAYIGMSRAFLRESRMNGIRARRTPGPPYVRVGARNVRYDLRDLDAWIDKNKVELKEYRDV